MRNRILSTKLTSVLLVTCILVFSAISSTGCSNKEVINQTEAISESTQNTTKETVQETTQGTIEETEETKAFTRKEITVDYYKIPELYHSYLTQEEIDAYYQLVTAWLNYEPMVEFDNPNVMTHVWGMIQECFFIAYGDFDESRGFIVEGNRVTFSYISESKEEHDEFIKAFEERVQFFFEDIDESEEGVDLARHLYFNYNQTLDYDYSVPESENYTFANSSGYTALMHGSGVCMSFAKGYSYLARQAGFEAFDVSGWDHEWGVIQMDNKYYFVDPTWDYTTPNPYDYRYFCFGLDQRIEDGYLEEDMILCCNGDFKMSNYVEIERNRYGL